MRSSWKRQGGGELWPLVVLLVALWESAQENIRANLRREGKKGRPERGTRVVGTHRILRSLPAAMVDSGEQFCEDGGVSGSRSRGRKGRGLWRLYGGV
jgi:hypothetical protein